MNKDTKSIASYGFLLFLLIATIVTLIRKDSLFVKYANGLSLPIFLLTLSVLLSKSNEGVKLKLIEKAKLKRKKIKTAPTPQKSQPFPNDNTDYKTASKTKSTKKSFSDSLSTIYKFINILTECINCIAILSFALCFLVLTGIITFEMDSSWINIASLSLVFFDFCVLDDLIDAYVKCLFKKLQSKYSG